MSRNRCETECECGFWRFWGEREIPVGDSSLMTEGEYLRAIDWEKCPYRGNGGYGWLRYDAGREGDFFWWRRSPDGNGGSNGPQPGYVRELIGTYQHIPPEDRLRFRRLDCRVCRRVYAGWYSLQPYFVRADGESDPPMYSLYDTSFFYAFNDEPSDQDAENVINWTPEEVVAALHAYRQTK